MEKKLMNYETLLNVTRVISHSRDPEEVVLMAVESITTSLKVKGCSVFLINRSSNNLELAASFGLSDEYLNKGPVILSENPIDQAAMAGRIVRIADAPNDPVTVGVHGEDVSPAAEEQDHSGRLRPHAVE